MMCKVLGMTRQNYYKYRNITDKDYYDYLEVKRVFEEGKELYGARRVKKALLVDSGWIINLKKVRRIMKKYGLRVKYHKVFRKNAYAKIIEENVKLNLIKRYQEVLDFDLLQISLDFLTAINYNIRNKTNEN